MRRLAIVLAALALAACGRPTAGGFGGSDSDETSYGSGEVVEIDLSAGAPESMDAGGLFQLPARRTYVGLIRDLERASEDEDTTGYFVRLGGGELGWARSEEVGRLLHDLKKRTKKPVVCHAHALSNAGMLLAARGCDRIWLSPAGGVEAVGIAAQVVYLKSALDKLEVQADFVHMGKYKSAAESLTRDGPSEPARESLEKTLRSIRKTWLDGVAKHRKAKRIRHDLEHGPWSAKEAKQHGLVDAVGYESEAREDAKKRAEAESVEAVFGPDSRAEGGMDLAELIRILAGADQRTGGRPRIAVVPAVGGITMSAGGLFGGGGISAQAMNKTLRRLADDDSVKAVVLRIDSPGGSALASDLMWHELMELRKKKPIVASVGSMAASGGYYLACAGNRIVAERTSIVGSIGVVGGKVVIGPALEQVGINSVTFAASTEPGAKARSAYLSALTPWDDATRQRVKKGMRDIYDLFIDRVAKGRKMKAAKVEASAQGRIWTALQAKDRGLVDELGGLHRALEVARELGELDERAPVTVEGTAESLLEVLMLGEGASASDVEAALARYRARTAPLAELVPDELMPFVQSTEPLVGRETTLTALPFALTVR